MEDRTSHPKPLARILATRFPGTRKPAPWRGSPGEPKPLCAVLGEAPPTGWGLEEGGPRGRSAESGASILLTQAGRRHIDAHPAGPDGPAITFENDVKGAPNPDLPVTDATARMVEDVAAELGVTININSTTGGDHAKDSNHYRGKAVDINRVDGKPVGPDNEAARRLQEALRNHPNIRENFGPYINEKTHGGVTTPRPEMGSSHPTHIHVSGQE